MFTGIIEGTGKIKAVLRKNEDMTIAVHPPFLPSECKLGESISVDGVCLTVKDMNKECLFMDVSKETISRTTLGLLKTGDLVNIERAVKLSDRLGGHIVLGHVDGIGRIVSKMKSGRSWIIRIEADEDILKYIVEKGSVAIDGISLTVNRCEKGFFEINIIPETAKRTTILRKRIDLVNIETDIIGKYVEKLLERKESGITEEKLKKYGFI